MCGTRRQAALGEIGLEIDQVQIVMESQDTGLQEGNRGSGH